MIIFYRFITNLLYPFLIILIYFRKVINKENKKRFKEKIFSSYFNVKRNENSKLIWFHAASVGEVKSILPLIKELNNKNNNIEFLITTLTLSSGNLVEEKIKIFNNVKHRFFPLDINHLVKKFISEWKPNRIIFVDSEIWPNFIHSINKAKIPFALVNARMTLKSYSKWLKIKKFSKSLFGTINLCLTSNHESIKYLSELGVSNIFHFGNLKLINSSEDEFEDKFKKRFLENKIFWLAASTHPGEEEFCIQTHQILKKKFPKLITIIAPRHIHRSLKIRKLCNSSNLKSVILNKKDKLVDNFEIIILNAFGILPIYFKHAKAVFVGKSLIKKLRFEGGQNPIEAARFGCKIYHGNYVYNFQEVYEILGQNNISKNINSPEELAEYLIKDLQPGQKKFEEVSKFMDTLSERTLKDTIDKVNKFVE